VKKHYWPLVVLLLMFLFRGNIFRLCVSYEPMGQRDFIALTDAELVTEISAWVRLHKAATIEDRIAYARSLTASRVSFVMRTTSGRPDDIVQNGVANCVGYARLFAAILDRAAGDGQLKQEILVGELSVFGQSLHQLTNDPFWRDHDYNKITDVNSGEVWFLDATLYDYLGVRQVTSCSL
jgi:hypothetical protein